MRTTSWLSIRLPAPPMTAPMPNGTRRPTVLADWRTTNRFRNIDWMRPDSSPTRARGRLLVTISPQKTCFVGPFPKAWPANCWMRFLLALPSISDWMSVRARTGSEMGRPWISATACPKSEVISRNPAVSTPVTASEAAVPTPGTIAAAPAAPPLTVVALRYCCSIFLMSSLGVASGYLPRRMRICRTTIGRWIAMRRSSQILSCSPAAALCCSSRGGRGA
ncbi:hypothetical protein ACFPRL_29890 [Pseudoclavibacter helvolus]